MATRKPAEAPKPINDYGYYRQYGRHKMRHDGLPFTQFNYDSWAFAIRRPVDLGGPDRPTVFKDIANVLVPKWFEWHSWTDTMIETLCDHRWVGMAGCGSAAKTWNVCGFACVWWMAAPDISSVILCSTTVSGLKRRAWANIQKFYASLPGIKFGNFVGSQTTWQCTKGDYKHSITGIAVEKGDIAAAADRIKGWHTERQLVIVDEATAVPPAIFDACTNLYTGAPREFMLVMLANPRSRLDEFGKFCEPANGWQSVSVDTDQWETREQLDGRRGVVVRFDAEKSPNIVEGKVVSKYLPTVERVASARKSMGENNPLYWSNQRGFWAPEGLCKTIFSETSIEKHGGRGKHEFTGSRFEIIAALDPARTGGDRAVLRFAGIGEITDGKWGIEVGPPIVVPLNARSTNPINYQLIEQVKRECENVTWRGQKGYSCPPQNVGIDATGDGAGVVDIGNRLWSIYIKRVVFSESPSEDACSIEDTRPANEVYRNKRVEMYFRARNSLESGQLKGLDIDTCVELSTIEFDDSQPKLKLMSKEDYREKFGKSPDFADTIAILMEVARQKGFKISPVGQTVNLSADWDRQCDVCQAVYDSIDYAEEELVGDSDY